MLPREVVRGTVESSNFDGYRPTLLPRRAVQVPGCHPLFVRPFCHCSGLFICLSLGRDPYDVYRGMRAYRDVLPTSGEPQRTLRPRAAFIASASYPRQLPETT